MIRKSVRPALVSASALILASCSDGGGGEEAPAPAGPQDAFWAALTSHCGGAYAGALVSDDEADADMQGADMVMHVRDC